MSSALEADSSPTSCLNDDADDDGGGGGNRPVRARLAGRRPLDELASASPTSPVVPAAAAAAAAVAAACLARWLGFGLRLRVKISGAWEGGRREQSAPTAGKRARTSGERTHRVIDLPEAALARLRICPRHLGREERRRGPVRQHRRQRHAFEEAGGQGHTFWKAGFNDRVCRTLFCSRTGRDDGERIGQPAATESCATGRRLPLGTTRAPAEVATHLPSLALRREVGVRRLDGLVDLDGRCAGPSERYRQRRRGGREARGAAGRAGLLPGQAEGTKGRRTSCRAAPSPPWLVMAVLMSSTYVCFGRGPGEMGKEGTAPSRQPGFERGQLARSKPLGPADVVVASPRAPRTTNERRRREPLRAGGSADAAQADANAPRSEVFCE